MTNKIRSNINAFLCPPSQQTTHDVSLTVLRASNSLDSSLIWAPVDPAQSMHVSIENTWQEKGPLSPRAHPLSSTFCQIDFRHLLSISVRRYPDFSQRVPSVVASHVDSAAGKKSRSSTTSNRFLSQNAVGRLDGLDEQNLADILAATSHGPQGLVRTGPWQDDLGSLPR
jgi:hypothetical protein